jgi:transcription initiation factor TFIIIB Brf1 subunit/transcription initiation factor TFIIB
MRCPKCGSEAETDDNAHYQCTNLGCINAWFPFTYEEKLKDGEKDEK